MLSNLFKVGWRLKNCWRRLLYAEVISFFATSKCQKSKKLMKVVNIEEENLHINTTSWKISIKFSEKMWHMAIILKVTKKQGFTLSMKNTFRWKTEKAFSRFTVNIYLNDISLLISKCQPCNYANESGKNMEKIKNNLEMVFMILPKWFHKNDMVLNPGKCHYTVIIEDDPSHKMILNNNEIASFKQQKLIGILLNSKLNFEPHITSLC